MVDILRRNNVRVVGSGDQAIMLAHGFGCDQNVWRHFIKAYQGNYKLIIFDYVGAGRSMIEAYDSVRYSSLDGYAEDILEIIETLNLTNIIFIGHSVSSMIGVKAVLKNPGYFKRLVFVAPSPCYINDLDYAGGLERSDLDALFTVMDNNYLGWSGYIAPLIMGNADKPELGAELETNFCATDPDIAKEFARVTFFSDSREDLESIKIPSLTLQCSDDMLAPLSVGYFINEHMANNSLVILKATGHCPHLSAPEETINEISQFITD